MKQGVQLVLERVQRHRAFPRLAAANGQNLQTTLSPANIPAPLGLRLEPPRFVPVLAEAFTPKVSNLGNTVPELEPQSTINALPESNSLEPELAFSNQALATDSRQFDEQTFEQTFETSQGFESTEIVEPKTSSDNLVSGMPSEGEFTGNANLPRVTPANEISNSQPSSQAQNPQNAGVQTRAPENNQVPNQQLLSAISQPREIQSVSANPRQENPSAQTAQPSEFATPTLSSNLEHNISFSETNQNEETKSGAEEILVSKVNTFLETPHLIPAQDKQTVNIAAESQLESAAQIEAILQPVRSPSRLESTLEALRQFNPQTQEHQTVSQSQPTQPNPRAAKTSGIAPSEATSKTQVSTQKPLEPNLTKPQVKPEKQNALEPQIAPNTEPQVEANSQNPSTIQTTLETRVVTRANPALPTEFVDTREAGIEVVQAENVKTHKASVDGARVELDSSEPGFENEINLSEFQQNEAATLRTNLVETGESKTLPVELVQSPLPSTNSTQPELTREISNLEIPNNQRSSEETREGAQSSGEQSGLGASPTPQAPLSEEARERAAYQRAVTMRAERAKRALAAKEELERDPTLELEISEAPASRPSESQEIAVPDQTPSLEPQLQTKVAPSIEAGLENLNPKTQSSETQSSETQSSETQSSETQSSETQSSETSASNQTVSPDLDVAIENNSTRELASNIQAEKPILTSSMTEPSSGGLMSNSRENQRTNSTTSQPANSSEIQSQTSNEIPPKNPSQVQSENPRGLQAENPSEPRLSTSSETQVENLNQFSNEVKTTNSSEVQSETSRGLQTVNSNESQLPNLNETQTSNVNQSLSELQTPNLSETQTENLNQFSSEVQTPNSSEVQTLRSNQFLIENAIEIQSNQNPSEIQNSNLVEIPNQTPDSSQTAISNSSQALTNPNQNVPASFLNNTQGVSVYNPQRRIQRAMPSPMPKPKREPNEAEKLFADAPGMTEQEVLNAIRQAQGLPPIVTATQVQNPVQETILKPQNAQAIDNLSEETLEPTKQAIESNTPSFNKTLIQNNTDARSEQTPETRVEQNQQNFNAVNSSVGADRSLETLESKTQTTNVTQNNAAQTSPPSVPVQSVIVDAQGSKIHVFNPPNRRVLPPKPKVEIQKTEAQKLFEDMEVTETADELFQRVVKNRLKPNLEPQEQNQAQSLTPESINSSLEASTPSINQTLLPNLPNLKNRKPLNPSDQTANTLFTGNERLQLGASERVQLSQNATRFLKPIVGIDPNEAKIYRDPQTQRLTQAARADALTVGETVLLSSENPLESPETLGLIAHELTHVARNRQARFVPPVARGNSNLAASAQAGNEEGLALGVEALARQGWNDFNQTSNQNSRSQSTSSNTETNRSSYGGLPAPADLPQWFIEDRMPPQATSRPAPRASNVASSAPSESPFVPTAPTNQMAASVGAQAASQERDVPTPPPAAGPLPASPQPKPEPIPNRAAPDLDAMARQVYTILKRRLANERHRM